MNKIIIFLLKHFTNIYNTLSKFPKEDRDNVKLYWSFGRWRDNPCLPVWRRGPILKLIKRKHIGTSRLFKDSLIYKGERKCYQVINLIHVKVGTKTSELNGKSYTYPIYKATNHKLPKGISSFYLVWNRNIRKKLKKYHLTWIKPEYQLPIWLSFHIFNFDVIYKWKYDYICFEFPPQFTIIAFGLSLSFWLRPIDPPSGIDDIWWEEKLENYNKAIGTKNAKYRKRKTSN